MSFDFGFFFFLERIIFLENSSMQSQNRHLKKKKNQ